MCYFKATNSISFAFKTHILAQKEKYFPMSSMLLFFLQWWIKHHFKNLFLKCVFQVHRTTYNCYKQYTLAYKCLIYWILQSKTSARISQNNCPSPVLHSASSAPPFVTIRVFHLQLCSLPFTCSSTIFYLGCHHRFFLKLLANDLPCLPLVSMLPFLSPSPNKPRYYCSLRFLMLSDYHWCKNNPFLSLLSPFLHLVLKLSICIWGETRLRK